MAPLLVGLSGPTCSGKTTLARYLQSILPLATILHEDDFYRPAAQLPYRAGLQNWDCAAAVDQKRLVEVLGHIREEGKVPPGLRSKEEYVEPTGVGQAVLEELRSKMGRWVDKRGLGALDEQGASQQQRTGRTEIVLVEGFLLFGKSTTEIGNQFDLRILLRGKYEDIKRRRESRKGYITDEGFWEDPEGYVDLVVWPEYVEEHSFLFNNKDLNASVDEETAHERDIHVCPTDDMEGMLRWAVQTLTNAFPSTE